MIRKICALAVCLLFCGQLVVAAPRALPLQPGAPSPQRTAPKIDLSGDFSRLFPARTYVYGEVMHFGSLFAQLGGSGTLFDSLNEYFDITSRGDKKQQLTDREFSSLIDSSGAMAMMAGEEPKPDVKNEDSYRREYVGGVLRFGTPQAAVLMRTRVFPAMFRTDPDAEPIDEILGQKVYGGGNGFTYVVVENHVVFGDKDAIRAILETASSRDARRLGDDPGYGTVVSKLAGGQQQVFIFISSLMISSVTDRLFGFGSLPAHDGATPAELQTRAWADAIRSFLGLSAIRGVAITGRVDSDRASMRVDVEVNRGQTGLVSVLADPPVVSFSSAETLPTNVNFMNVASVDFARIFDLMEQYLIPVEAGEQPGNRSISETVAKIETWTGLRVRNDLLPAIGHEVALVGNYNPFNAVFGAAQAPNSVDVAMIELQNPPVIEQAFKAALDHLRTSEEIPIPKDFQLPEYKGVTLWQLPGLPASVAIVGGFLIMGSQQDIQKCIDARESGQTLATVPEYSSQAINWYGDTILASYTSQRYMEDLKKAMPQLPDEGNVDEYVLRKSVEEMLFDPRTMASARYVRDATGIHWEQGVPAKPFIAFYNYVLKDALVDGPRRQLCWENEGDAMSFLSAVAQGQAEYKKKNNRYATLDELVALNVVSAEAATQAMKAEHGYRFDFSAGGEGDGARFHLAATPVTYAKTGFRSFYVDEARVIHAADKQGSAAGPGDPAFGGAPSEIDTIEYAEPAEPEMIDGIPETYDTEEPPSYDTEEPPPYDEDQPPPSDEDQPPPSDEDQPPPGDEDPPPPVVE